MDSGHKSLDDAEVIVQHFGDGGEAVGGARRIREDWLARVLLVVHAHDEHRGRLRRGRDADTACASLEVCLGFVNLLEYSSGLDHGVNSAAAPWDVSRVLLGEYRDSPPIYEEVVSPVRNVALKHSMCRV